MLRVIAGLLMLTVAGMGSAAADDAVDTVRAAVAKIIPGSTPDSIKPSQLPGMYEVTMGADVFYVSEDGRYLFHGNLLDLSKGGENLTENKRAEGRLKLLSTVDESQMIVFAPKKVKHTITVFTDIDCPYCRRLHSEMPQINALGIKVRYLFFPRAGKKSKSYDKAVAVWCAKDRKQALTDAKAGKHIDMKTCKNPVDKHMELVNELGVDGTPTMVLENGQIIPGYVPPARLASILDSEAARR
jgi:thiol:disulfide interchange protein DsbC